jgi:hypothetical protein
MTASISNTQSNSSTWTHKLLNAVTWVYVLTFGFWVWAYRADYPIQSPYYRWQDGLRMALKPYAHSWTLHDFSSLIYLQTLQAAHGILTPWVFALFPATALIVLVDAKFGLGKRTRLFGPRKWLWMTLGCLWFCSVLAVGSCPAASAGRALNFTFALTAIVPVGSWIWSRQIGHAAETKTQDIRGRFSAQQPESYQPEKYFRIERGLFMGLDTRRKPVYLNWQDFRSTHLQLLGPTGTGKGTAQQVLLAQCLMAGETVVILDPKDDRYLPGVMRRVAERCNVPFHLLDLRADAPPQFNLLAGATREELIDLLTLAFQLTRRETDADYYRGNERVALIELAQHIQADQCLAELVPILTTQKNYKDTTLASGIQELATLEPIRTRTGLSLKNTLEQSGLLYVIGSEDSERTRVLQQSTLLRMMQIIKRRKNQERPIALMLDEFTNFLTTPTLRALGSIRDRNCHVLLAHQSKGNLAAGKGLDPNETRGVVLDNIMLKLIYRANDSDTAEWAARLSGTVTEYAASRAVKQEMFQTEHGHLIEQERPFLAVNDFLSLPRNVAVLYGSGAPQLVQFSPLTAGERPQIVPALRYEPNVNGISSVDQVM